jgi:hypothetical protein
MTHPCIVNVTPERSKSRPVDANVIVSQLMISGPLMSGTLRR